MLTALARKQKFLDLLFYLFQVTTPILATMTPLLYLNFLH